MKGDKGLMIVSTAIIVVGIVTLLFDTTVGFITTLSGVGMFLMGYLSKKPGKKSE
jgi:hypothetical protein